MDKTKIRSEALEKRKALTEEEQEDKSNRIIHRLEGLEIFESAKRVLAYFSHNAEVRTQEFMEKWLNQKTFLLPRLGEGDTFIALPFSSLNELEENQFGIPEPVFLDEAPPRPDLIIVPGVAFDREGNRIGMGKGYYDRFLADLEGVPKVGLAYSQQVLDALPKDPYDVPIDLLITEDEVIRC